MTNKKINIGVIGLGYVGLPLALELGKYFSVVGYDKNVSRISQLRKNKDDTNEVNRNNFLKSKKILFTSNSNLLSECNIFIVTVPTPVNFRNIPDLSFLKSATILISKYIKKKDIVVYESTGFPGMTEDICVPILEKNTGFLYKKDFDCGYSPERVNPGDKHHRIHNIKKIVSASSKKSLILLRKIYGKIVKVGIFSASSIKVAEAAKVIENTQRDLNIALVNEISIICQKLKIDTKEVIEAAATKWNFHKYSPGLVGGHCIGVDPYYLTYKSKLLGYKPKIILAGRKLNDSMIYYVFKRLKSSLKKKKINSKYIKILFLGASFKENCPDIRNSQSLKLARIVKKKYQNTFIYEPYISSKDIYKNKDLIFKKKLKKNFYDVIILSVPHKILLNYIKNIKKYLKKKNIVYDLKGVLPIKNSDFRL